MWVCLYVVEVIKKVEHKLTARLCVFLQKFGGRKLSALNRPSPLPRVTHAEPGVWNAPLSKSEVTRGDVLPLRNQRVGVLKAAVCRMTNPGPQTVENRASHPCLLTLIIYHVLLSVRHSATVGSSSCFFLQLKPLLGSVDLDPFHQMHII